MTITEANAANVVLRDLLDRHRHDEETASNLEPQPDQLIDAAALLADKANKALGAGLTGQRVREALAGGAS